MRMKVVLAIYLTIGAVNIILGVIYFSSKQFLSYHAQAVGVPWKELDSGIQVLILALMKVTGGGWLTLGFFTTILALTAYKTGNTIARWTLPVGTLLFYSASFTATWGVYKETGAPTPWGQSLAMIGFAFLALVIDKPWSSHIRGVK